MIKVNPNVPMYYYRTMDLCLKLGGSYQQLAMEMIDACIDCQSNYPDYSINEDELYLLRGQLMLKQNQIEKAILDFTLVLEKNENSAEALQYRANAFEQSNRLMDAFEDYNRIIALPNDDRNSIEGKRIGYVFLMRYYFDLLKDREKALVYIIAAVKLGLFNYAQILQEDYEKISLAILCEVVKRQSEAALAQGISLYSISSSVTLFCFPSSIRN